jgi:hypothetical protein
MNNVQDVLQLIMKTDVRLLACLALLLIVLLFWRVIQRTSRLDKEINRLNERFERVRDEVRGGGQKPLLTAIPPAGAELAADATVEEGLEEVEAAPDESFSFDVEPSPLDAAAEAEEVQAAAGENSFDPFERDSFSFDSEQAEDVAAAAVDTPAAQDSEEPAAAEPDQPEEESAAPSWMEPSFRERAFAASEDETAAQGFEEPAATEPDQPGQEPAPEDAEESAAEETVAAEAEGPVIVRLEDDPNRPDICLARCLACNYKLAYPEKLSGKRIRCPSCKSEHVLP